MKYVKLFESWLDDKVFEATEVNPIEVAKAFPIDADQYGTMHFVANMSEDRTEDLAKYLQSKLNGFSKNLKTKSGSPISFKTTYNKDKKVVEIVASNRPDEKFMTQGEYLSKGNAKAGKIYPNTMFTYVGFMTRGEEESGKNNNIFIDVAGKNTEDIPLGMFIAAALENKDVEDIKVKTPTDLAVTLASVIDTKNEGKPSSFDNIVSKVKSGVGDNLAPKEGGK